MTKIEPFGKGTTLHHVGMVVPSIQDVCASCQLFHDPIQRVNVAFVEMHGLQLELIEPNGENSPVLQSLQKGTKLVHLCYEVENLENTLTLAAKHGYRCIGKPVPAVAFDQRRIAWVFHLGYGLVELLERQQ